jgi:hypothetical protein
MNAGQPQGSGNAGDRDEERKRINREGQQRRREKLKEDPWTKAAIDAAQADRQKFRRRGGEPDDHKPWRYARNDLRSAAAAEAKSENMDVGELKRNWFARIASDADVAKAARWTAEQFKADYLQRRGWRGESATGPESSQAAFAPGLQGGHQQPEVTRSFQPGWQEMVTAARTTPAFSGYGPHGARNLPSVESGPDGQSESEKLFEAARRREVLKSLPFHGKLPPIAEGNRSAHPSNPSAFGDQQSQGQGQGGMRR